MPITFACEACGKSFTVPDNLAGKKGQCKQCGAKFAIPARKTADPFGLEDLASEAEEAEAVVIPRATSRSSAPSKGDGTFLKVAIGAGAGVGLLAVLAITFSLLRKPTPPKPADDEDREARANLSVPENVEDTPAPGKPAQASNPVPWTPAATNGRIPYPVFPEPGPAHEIEPGITFQEVDLGPPHPSKPPGSSGKIWLYLPAGNHAARSLPCVLISDNRLLPFFGIELFETNQREHLPYARAGFAVVAFEVDGALDDPSKADREQLGQAMVQFFRANNGLVNAGVAFEYASKKIPAVDPNRISIVGRSVSGTLALIYASGESRIQSCVAIEPINDVEAYCTRSYGAELIGNIKKDDIGDPFGKHSPKNRESFINCPLFLLYDAQGDSAGDLVPFINRRRAAGKPIMVKTFSKGSEDILFEQAIPAAVAWLKQQQLAPHR